MPLPVRSLPVVQRWDCHACSNCCRTYHVQVTPAERIRVATFADLASVQPTVVTEPGLGPRLNHTADGACVFLDENNRCRIHAKHGEAAKPMACRIYPFVLVPAGDHWRVGIRYGCPSAEANKGKPLAEHAADISTYAGLLEADAVTTELPVPPLRAGQTVPWPDLLRINKAVLSLLAGDGPVELRLRRVLALMDLCRPLKFDGITGKQLGEMMAVLAATAADETPTDPASVPAPGWVGRMLFRQTAAVYARKDVGPTPGVGTHGRLARIRAGWRFAVGTGAIPRVHGLMPITTFAAAEVPTGPLPASAEDLLGRYVRVKAESMQFCGPTNFHASYWDGLAGLVLTVPVVRWLARVLTTADRPAADAVSLAVQIVDDNFGFNPLLGGGRHAWAVRTLADRGETAKLVAWYSR